MIRAAKRKRGRPKSTTDDTSNPGQGIKTCSYCLTQLYPGCCHNCYKDRHRTQKVDNLMKLLATPKSFHLFASRIIKSTKDNVLLDIEFGIVKNQQSLFG